MIEQHLGRTIDIHAGGNDLKFPHHENEIAQSVCVHDGQSFCKYWLHNGLINVDREKMSKSIGNVLLVRDLLDEAPGEAIRMALISGHYRKPLDWNDATVPNALRELDRLYAALREVVDIEVETNEDDEAPAAVVDALEDDLNTPVARTRTFEIVRALNSATAVDEKASLKRDLLAAGRMLGIGQSEPQAWFERRTGDGGDIEAINRLVAARNKARQDKDFATADRIRDDLVEQGIVLEDGPEGTRWRKVG